MNTLGLILRMLSLSLLLPVANEMLCRSAYADSVSLTLEATTLTVTPGDSIVLSFTLANNSGQTIVYEGYDVQVGFGLGGTFVGFTNTCAPIGQTLDSGSSCFFSFTDVSPQVTSDVIALAYYCPGGWICQGAFTGQIASAVAHVAVVEPTSVPEPSSMLFLGSGVVILLGGFRRSRYLP